MVARMAQPRTYRHEITGLTDDYDPRVALAIPALKEVVEATPEPEPAPVVPDPVDEVAPTKPVVKEKAK